jgi:hypothetical protein
MSESPQNTVDLRSICGTVAVKRTENLSPAPFSHLPLGVLVEVAKRR